MTAEKIFCYASFLDEYLYESMVGVYILRIIETNLYMQNKTSEKLLELIHYTLFLKKKVWSSVR